jgi:hypothetical protein
MQEFLLCHAVGTLPAPSGEHSLVVKGASCCNDTQGKNAAVKARLAMVSIKGGLVKAGFRADNFGHRSYPKTYVITHVSQPISILIAELIQHD